MWRRTRTRFETVCAVRNRIPKSKGRKSSSDSKYFNNNKGVYFFRLAARKGVACLLFLCYTFLKRGLEQCKKYIKAQEKQLL